MHKVHTMHLHVGNVTEGEAYETISEPLLDQQQPDAEADYLEDLNQSSEEPKAVEEGKHWSMSQF